MKENKGMWAAVAALLPPLIIAATGWLEAHREAKVEEKQKFAALDSYGEYIEDRLNRDAALAEALRHCMALLPAAEEGPAAPPEHDLAPAFEGVFEGAGSSYAMGAGTGEAEPSEATLDDLAEEFGYEQKQVNP